MHATISKRLLPLLMLAATMLLVACGQTQQTPTATPTPRPPEVGKVITTEKGNQYRDLAPEELKAMMDRKDFFHVDVHVPHEGRLPQIDARVPYDKITEQLNKLPDKAAKIVLTCKSGGMSTQAAGQLADLGYTNVYNLAGGFLAWKDRGYDFTAEP